MPHHDKPPITVSTLDMERIEALLDKGAAPPAARQALEAELARADVREPQDMPPDVVTMHSTVRCTLLQSGRVNTLTLVYPREMAMDAADGNDGKVSIFAPVGMALLGLRAGDTFAMPGPAGPVTVRVDGITFQPESAGQLHR